MDRSPRRANNPNDESLATNCPKCQGARIWTEVVAEGAWGHYSRGGVARTRGHSFVLGPDKLYSNCRALVCSECGYTQFYATKPAELLSS
jgi:predicted nucleic-acid-binding Zn-ribbon protein